MAQSASSSNGSGNRLRELWAWWPAKLAAGLFASTAFYEIGHETGLFSPSAPPGISVDLPHVSATTSAASVMLDLPYTVVNGSEDTVRSVSVWVNVYACRSQASPVTACVKVHSSEQDADFILSPGTRRELSDRLNIVLPDERPGDVIKVEREISSIVTQSDIDHADKFRSE